MAKGYDQRQDGIGAAPLFKAYMSSEPAPA